MDDIWQDIGLRESDPEARVKIDALLNRKQEEHESVEITAQRKARSLEWIFKTFDDPLIESDFKVVAEWAGKKFDFYPGSDCWYSHSKQRYGHGIQNICELVMKIKGSQA